MQMEKREISYRCREDWVLLRIVTLGKSGSIHLPDTAQEGKVSVVISFGPKVEGLKCGDKVRAFGAQGGEISPFHMFYLPGHTDLVAIRQSNVALVIEE